MDVLVDTLSGSVVGICVFIKLPIILNVFRSGTTRGMSISALLLEFWCFSHLLAYSFAQNYRIMSFMEFIFLCIQDIILLFLCAKEKKSLNLASLLVFSLFTIYIGMFLQNAFPTWFMKVTLSTVMPFASSSKILQFITIYKNGEKGAVSSLTWGLASYCASVRVFTNMVQNADWMVLILSVQAAVLNSAVFLICLYYGDSKTKKL